MAREPPTIELFERQHQAFSRLYEAAHQRVTRLHPDLAALARTPASQGSGGAGAHDVFLAYLEGRDLLNTLTHVKRVPPADRRLFERASREFGRIKVPKDLPIWFAKNHDVLRMLLESRHWPNLDADQDAENGVVQMTAGMRIVNQAGDIDLDATLRAIEVCADLVRRSGVPDAQKILYGDVFLVGEVRRKKTVAAYYVPALDTMYVLVLKRFATQQQHTIIHELGHRYWTRFASESVKSAWREHHRNLASGADVIEYPKVGEPIEGVKGNPVVRSIRGDRITFDKGFIGFRAWVNWAKSQSAARFYPTTYAQTDAEEHFCEAFAMYALGTLPDVHREAFERLVVST